MCIRDSAWPSLPCGYHMKTIPYLQSSPWSLTLLFLSNQGNRSRDSVWWTCLDSWYWACCPWRPYQRARAQMAPTRWAQLLWRYAHQHDRWWPAVQKCSLSNSEFQAYWKKLGAVSFKDVWSLQHGLRWYQVPTFFILVKIFCKSTPKISSSPTSSQDRLQLQIGIPQYTSYSYIRVPGMGHDRKKVPSIFCTYIVHSRTPRTSK